MTPFVEDDTAKPIESAAAKEPPAVSPRFVACALNGFCHRVRIRVRPKKRQPCSPYSAVRCKCGWAARCAGLAADAARFEAGNHDAGNHDGKHNQPSHGHRASLA